MAVSLASSLRLMPVDVPVIPTTVGVRKLRRTTRPNRLRRFPTICHESITTADLQQWSEEYLCDCDLRLQSPRTIETRRIFLRNLLWFLLHRDYAQCGTTELRQFFHYLLHGHEDPGGRFGHPHLKRPVRPITLKDYYICLRSFFGWLVEKGEITETPFTHIPKPQVRETDKPPLSPGQITELLRATQTGAYAARDEALLYWLLDTGCRATETVSLQLRDLDLKNRSCSVLGKGNKYRTVYFGAKTAEVLERYLRQRGNAPDSHHDYLEGDLPLFLSGQGNMPLTRSGLQQLLERLGKRCGIKGSCSPHAFRRSFAVQTLRNGANVFSVQAMLGHSDLEMTRRYCALAQTDVEAQHRRFSPVDRLCA